MTDYEKPILEIVELSPCDIISTETPTTSVPGGTITESDELLNPGDGWEWEMNKTS